MSKVLVISDLQAPFHHPKSLDFLKRIRDKHKIGYYPGDKIVVIGDEIDFKFLKYSTVNDPETAYVQHYRSLKFLREVYIEFPEAYVCESNHVKERLDMVAEQANIPSFLLKDIPEILDSPKGWKRGYDWFIEGVRYCHGHRIPRGLNGMARAIDQAHCSVVYGHHAHAGIQHVVKNDIENGKLKNFFSMCVGALTVNPLGPSKAAYGMKYSLKYGNPMPIGCGVVIDGKIPIWEPLLDE